MSARQVFLVRHAEAAGSGAQDPPLSERGRWQAAALGARLAGAGVTRVLHSPRRRAVETAEILGAALDGATVESCDLLDDRTPVPSPARRAEYPQRWWEWLDAVPAAEQDVDGDGDGIDEAGRALAELLGASAGPVVAVSHAFVVGRIVQVALGAPAATWLRLAPANAGLTVLDVASGELRLGSYNDVGHLGPQ